MNPLIPPPGFSVDQNIEDYENISYLCRMLLMKPEKKIWVPSEKELNLVDYIIDILYNYTLGIKDIIGLRQLLKNKMGEEFVNQFNKVLSSKSLLWKDTYVCCLLNECLMRRSSKFILIVKKDNYMFYLCQPSKIPDGFYLWYPSI
jgi:hypothetical protein